MRLNKRNEIVRLFQRDMKYFIVLFVFLLAGISAGSIGARLLDFSERKELVLFLRNYFSMLDTDGIHHFTVFINVMKRNFEPLFLVWLFSFTPAGIPAILFILSFTGFITGFSAAFVIEGLGYKGLLFLMTAILPQNFIYIPCFIFAAYFGMKYSYTQLNRLFYHSASKSSIISARELTVYLGGLFILMSAGAFMEAWLTPAILQMISSLFSI